MNDLFPPSALYFDLLLPKAPNQAGLQESLMRGLGRAASLFTAVEADEEIERALPRGPLLGKGEFRLFVVQAVDAPLASQPDLRMFLQLLLNLVEMTQAKFGIAGCWGEASPLGAIFRDRADLIGLGLVSWIYDDATGDDFRPGRGTQATKLPNFDKYKKALVERAVDTQLGAMPAGPYFVLDLLGKLGGKNEKGFEEWTKKAFAAFQVVAAPPPPKPVAAPEPPPSKTLFGRELGGRAVVMVPRERFSTAIFDGVVRGRPESFHKLDRLPGKVEDAVARKKAAFFAELPSLADLFYQNKILDKSTATGLMAPISGTEGVSFEAHLPRIGRVLVVGQGERFGAFSDADADPREVLGLLGEF